MDQYQKKFKTYIDSIVKHVPKKAGEEMQFFVRQFYDKMPVMDLETLEPELAALIAVNAHDFISSRTPHQPKIRVFTPQKKDYGWKSEKTVVEIIGDDMPFLVDSVTAELARHDLIIHELIHPVLRVKRDKKGNLIKVKERGDSANQRNKVTDDSETVTESFMHIHLSSLPDDVTAKSLEQDIQRVLQAVHYSVTDWRDILAKIEGNLDIIENAPTSFKAEDVKEVKDFLEWLRDNNFVFLGYMEYDFTDSKKESFKVVKDSEKGLFRMEESELKPKGLSALPQEVLHFARNPQLLEITKANMKSPVHRPIHMDYVSIKRFNKKGDVVGENRFLGLFTSRVYYQSADDIPIIRRKIDRTLQRANFDAVSHNGKALKAIMEFLPRDEMFQITEDQLFQMTMGILSLDARPDVRLFPRKDLFERFVSCMLYVPRDRFSTYLREKIQTILERAYEGKVTAYYTQVTDSPLARVHIIIATQPGKMPEVNIKKVEGEISKVTNLWSDTLLDALVEKYGEQKAEKFYRIYKNAFPANYITHYSSDSAVYDIQKIDEAVTSHHLALDLFRKKNDAKDFVRLKVYNPQRQVPLSDILPMLENMGFRVLDENPYPITPRSDKEDTIWVRDLRVTMNGIEDMDILSSKEQFEEALAHVWQGQMENDAFNALVLKANLDWRDVVMLRAYSKYLKQTGLSYSQDFVANALTNHPQITRKLVELFNARFDPKTVKELKKSEKKSATPEGIIASINKLLGDVSNLAEDRVVRLFINMMESTLRTNFFQPTEKGEPKDYISFKFDSRALTELPLPRPYREIFVYSMRIEGIHLRGGKVARGGLRWSDRHEDFRTEVLGLMKAQMVKNAIIVPVGSKGGFVVKQPPVGGTREEQLAEGIACYKTFLRGLLDVTDNIVSGKIVAPKSVVRHDEDDPYLVVAADKGTATFSDIANGISADYGFWLGDAFASGGSAGYDHKGMGITARGAWVSVERHFREMGRDCAKEDFTVVGIGDMAGDVFGNGMLLSKHIRLVGAFNHMHIFIDPNPDAAKTYKERDRLFKLPRSSWTDYDTKLISKGGGIFSRSEKTIAITKEMRECFDLPSDCKSLSPDQLIKAMLKAPVDLLWNGGIGTYVKGRNESHEDVGDRANNALRINGTELRCKVVGEGGNLGFTQRGRIEFARNGGRINTDALDNSAGVDCSDHEVNIKIAFSAAMEKEKISLKQRDKLLVEMTDEVARLVLRDNELQNQALSNAEAQGHTILESRARLIRAMEKSGLLNREIEYLPTDEELAERRAKKQGFTRPELAVILAYSKLALYQEVLDSTLPDDPYFKKDLTEYFPKQMQQKFATEIEGHALRREIIATVLTNNMINRVGSGFFHTMADDTGVKSCDVARSFAIARDAYELRPLWSDIEGLTGKVPAWVQAEMFVEINEFVGRITGWFLRNYPQPIDLSQAMKDYEPGIREFMTLAGNIASESIKKSTQKKYDYFLGLDVPKDIAKRVAELEMLSSACDVVRASLMTKLPVRTVGQIYFEVGSRMQLGWLRLAAEKLVIDSHWDRIAVTSIINDLFDQQRRLTMEVINGMAKGDDSKTAVEKWQSRNDKAVGRLLQCMSDLETTETIDFSMLVVAMRNVEMLTAQETKAAVA